MNGLDLKWSRYVGQGYVGLLANRYLVQDATNICNFWRSEMNLAYACYNEKQRRVVDGNFLFLASQICKQLLNLPLDIPNEVNHDLIVTPHDERARQVFRDYIDSKSSQYFKDLIAVYGELITAFSENPKLQGWDPEISGKFLMTFNTSNPKDAIQMSMLLRISKDATRSNHQYIVKSLTPELLHVFYPNRFARPPQRMSLQMHRMAAITTQIAFPTVKIIEIESPFPSMLAIFKKAGIDKPYTPEKFQKIVSTCIVCNTKASRMSSTNNALTFCDNQICVNSFFLK